MLLPGLRGRSRSSPLTVLGGPSSNLRLDSRGQITALSTYTLTSDSLLLLPASLCVCLLLMPLCFSLKEHLLAFRAHQDNPREPLYLKILNSIASAKILFPSKIILYGKRIRQRRGTRICITASLCCTSEMNTTLSINCIPI